MAWWSAILPALGINAGLNLIRGQDPLRNAIPAATIGGIGGLLGNTIPGAEVTANPVTDSAVNEIVPGSIESSGLVFNQATGTYLDPSQYVGESIGMPLYTGGQGLLSNAADELKASLSGITPQNLMGVASLLNQPDTSAYQSQAGVGGGVKQGSGQGLAVEMPQARVFKRRKA